MTMIQGMRKRIANWLVVTGALASLLGFILSLLGGGSIGLLQYPNYIASILAWATVGGLPLIVIGAFLWPKMKKGMVVEEKK